jgi:hypothetical protein
MLSSLKNRIGIPGVIAVIALIFAMFGGAYAATGSSGGATASKIKTIKGPTGKRGPAGKRGPTGPTGPIGPAGPAGAQGAKGDPGAQGDAGTPGAPGVSPAGTKFSGNANGCEEGGVKFVGTNTTVACNGLKGAPGADGQTGFTATLPPGETEYGTWALVKSELGELSAVSFVVPLAAPLDSSHVKFIKTGEEPVPSVCDDGEGTAPSAENPEADPGYLCAFAGPFAEEVTGISFLDPGAGAVGAAPGGAVLTSAQEGIGTWAVTAP